MSEGGSAGRVVRVCTLLAAIHSLLASRPAKDLARKLTGRRYRDGLYRFAYNVQSAASLAWVALWFLRQPDRELYRVRSPWSWLMRAAQAASLGAILSTIWVSGALSTGVPQVRNFLAGSDPRPAPEAQGPPLDASGEMATAGPFRFSRHPSNLAVIILFSLFPKMTVNRATLAALVAVYAVLGALHEEYRLLAAYGEAYEKYRREVPFLVPGSNGIG